MHINLTKIKAGDLIFVHTKGFSPVSWAIRFLTKSYWNHTGIIVEDKYRLNSWDNDTFTHKEYYIIEACFCGMIKSSLEKYLDSSKYDICIKRVKVSAYTNKKEYNEGIETAVEKARDMIGKKYDKGAIIYLGGKCIVRNILNRIPGLRKMPSLNMNLLQNRCKFFCSEGVCCQYRGTSSRYKNIFAGKKHPGQNCDTITPGDIYKSKNVYYITGTKS